MNKPQQEYIGSRFGRWLVIEESLKQGSFRNFLCVCDCGTYSKVRLYNLLRGGSRSCGCIAIEKAKNRTNSANVNWKGDKVGYGALHDWVRRRLKEPAKCENCGVEQKLDLANKSQEYKRDLTDWEWLCRRCHITNDGRVAALIRLTMLRPPKGTSKYKGVRWHKDQKKWCSQITKGKKSFHLGVFDCEEEAAIYYDVAAQLFHGDSTYLNNV